MKQSIFDFGPAVATFNVASDFLTYKDGIYSSDSCSNGDILFSHNLLIIGWGTDSTPDGPVDFWIAQNSWGIGWGQAGYAKIVIGKNLCGISDNLIVPSIVYDASIDKLRPF